MGKRKEIVPPEHCTSVRDYEASSWWSKKSRLLLDNKDLTCEICGRKRWVWQPRNKRWKKVLRFSTHHVRYGNAPHEKREDFMLICCACHEFFHNIHRYKKLAPVYEELFEWSKAYFHYEGIQTFIPW